MTERPHAESEIYKIIVKFYRGDMSDQSYKSFKEDVRKRFEENILPMSKGSAEARILRMEITKNEKIEYK